MINLISIGILLANMLTFNISLEFEGQTNIEFNRLSLSSLSSSIEKGFNFLLSLLLKGFNILSLLPLLLKEFNIPSPLLLLKRLDSNVQALVNTLNEANLNYNYIN